MKYFSIIAITLLISACAEFETLMQHQETQEIPDQLTCSPADSQGCIGFKIEEAF